MKIIFAATAAFTIALSGNALLAACDDGEMVIKLSHVTNTDKHPKGIAASLLQQRDNDEMNGKACMEVYPNSTLYNDNQVLEAMLQGDVQMAALGGSPQPMAFSEVYGALQTGVVDGQENTWSNIYGKKFFEVQDGVTETNHGIIDYMLVTSTDWWDTLDEGMRDQLSKIISEVTEARNSESTAVNESAKQEIISSGGVVRQLTSSQRDAWVAAMMPVWDQFKGDVGEDNIAAAQAINSNH